MDITDLDGKGLAEALRDLRKSTPESPWIALVEAQINIRAKTYHKAKKNLQIVMALYLIF